MILNINHQPINEVYIGKTPELIAIEKQLDVFRNKYMKDSSIKGSLAKANCNSDLDLLKINRALEDYFGFGCLSITVLSNIHPNAFTISLSSRYDVAESITMNLRTSKKGYKFNKSADYSAIIVVYDSIMFNPHFTTSEVMAVILHEIGHNFNMVLEGRHGLFTRAYVITNFFIACMNFNVLYLAATNNTIIGAMNKFEQQIQTNHKFSAAVMNYSIYTLELVKQLKEFPFILTKILTLGASHVILLLFNLLNTILFRPANMILQPMAYAHEREADNFATMYGYGPETVSLQNKFSSSTFDDTMKQLPLVGNIYALNIFLAELLINPIDPHPMDGNRMQDQLDLLKHEVKKQDLDPKMRKQILADIKVCESQLDKLRDTTKGIKDPDLVKHAYWRLCYKLFNNRTLKDMFMSLILGSPDHRFDEYDKMYKIYKEK